MEDYDQDFISSKDMTKKNPNSALKLQNIVGGSASEREKLIEHNIKLKTQIY